MRQTNQQQPRPVVGSSLLGQLRDLVPARSLSAREALLIAEAQARLLLKWSGVSTPPVPTSVITNLPWVRTVSEPGMPCSGSAHWTGQHWLIAVSADEPVERQRFSLFHEIKHVIDHRTARWLYPPDRRRSAELAEQLADHFAGCVLMPKAWITRLYCAGITDLAALASIFDVSQRAVEVRLHYVGLRDLGIDCNRHGLPPNNSDRLSLTEPVQGAAA